MIQFRSNGLGRLPWFVPFFLTLLPCLFPSIALLKYAFDLCCLCHIHHSAPSFHHPQAGVESPSWSLRTQGKYNFLCKAFPGSWDLGSSSDNVLSTWPLISWPEQSSRCIRTMVYLSSSSPTQMIKGLYFPCLPPWLKWIDKYLSYSWCWIILTERVETSD